MIRFILRYFTHQTIENINKGRGEGGSREEAQKQSGDVSGGG